MAASGGIASVSSTGISAGSGKSSVRLVDIHHEEPDVSYEVASHASCGNSLEARFASIALTPDQKSVAAETGIQAPTSVSTKPKIIIDDEVEIEDEESYFADCSGSFFTVEDEGFKAGLVDRERAHSEALSSMTRAPEDTRSSAKIAPSELPLPKTKPDTPRSTMELLFPLPEKF